MQFFSYRCLISTSAPLDTNGAARARRHRRAQGRGARPPARPPAGVGRALRGEYWTRRTSRARARLRTGRAPWAMATAAAAAPRAHADARASAGRSLGLLERPTALEVVRVALTGREGCGKSALAAALLPSRGGAAAFSAASRAAGRHHARTPGVAVHEAVVQLPRSGRSVVLSIVEAGEFGLLLGRSMHSQLALTSITCACGRALWMANKLND